jgi:hypothetical protein
MDIAPVAQLDRAPDYESGGQGFDSLRAHHSFFSNGHPSCQKVVRTVFERAHHFLFFLELLAFVFSTLHTIFYLKNIVLKFYLGMCLYDRTLGILNFSLNSALRYISILFPLEDPCCAR